MNTDKVVRKHRAGGASSVSDARKTGHPNAGFSKMLLHPTYSSCTKTNQKVVKGRNVNLKLLEENKG